MNSFINSLLVMINEMSPYILLGFLIAGILHAFVKPSLMSRHLSGNGIGAVVKAALIGIPLPLCSCGVLPTAVSLKRNGASEAATTSFLIATPQTGVDSIAATYSLLGLAFAIMRPIGALVGALFGGLSVGKLCRTKSTVSHTSESDLQSHSDECDVHSSCSCGEHDDCGCHDGCDCHSHELADDATFWQKCIESLRYGFVDMVGSVGKWLVIGLVIAACITVFVPDTLFLSLSRYPILAMIVMVIVAIPMYICATGSIPIALSLILKGLTPGVAFVLLMAGPAANFASVIVLRRAMGTRATAIYVGSVVITAIGMGMIIDYLLPASWFTPSATMGAMCHHHTFSVFDTICSIVLAVLLIYALLIRPHRHHHHEAANTEEDTVRTYRVKGMMCAHCQSTVKEGIESIDGVKSVNVDLGTGVVEVVGDVIPKTIIAKIESLGYDYVG